MDQGLIRSTIDDARELYDIRSVAYDPWNAEALRLDLEADGIEMYEFPQSLKNYTEPFKQFLSLISAGKIRHGDNPVLRWMASNLSAYEDASGNIRPDKSKSSDKIDGITACVMALALCMFEDTAESVYEHRGILQL